MDKKIIIYTDGAAKSNGEKNNIGAWAAIVKCELPDKTLYKEIYAAQLNVTNNQMELTGPIMALEFLDIKEKYKFPILLHSDSAYLVNAFNNGWLKKWENNGWQTQNGPVKNRELWIQLHSLYKKFDNIKFIKVRGHADNELNNRADELCNLAMDQRKLLDNGDE